VFLLGRSSKNPDYKDQKLPDSGNGIPSGWTPNAMAKRLHDVLSGINTGKMLQTWTSWWSYNAGHDERDRTLSEFANLGTDDMFVAVYNNFSGQYGKSDTLRGWIEDEVGINPDVYDAVMGRINRLQLS
ncbi:MAG: hypothetical protein AAF206_24510, partial [Bacteroidota bacterium]